MSSENAPCRHCGHAPKRRIEPKTHWYTDAATVYRSFFGKRHHRSGGGRDWEVEDCTVYGRPGSVRVVSVRGYWLVDVRDAEGRRLGSWIRRMQRDAVAAALRRDKRRSMS